jgi:hypothetical protein
MRLKILILIVLGISAQTIVAQSQQKIIKANSTQVDIRDGNTLKKGYWRIVPEANPDIYTTSSKKVTFYTDIDSISYDIEPNQHYDFVILLNEKDSARTRIAWEPSKLEILKKGNEYNSSDNRFIPEFIYLSQDNPNLVIIRETLKLDSIAGKGSELSQIFNLLHWVHNTVKHDGNSNNPENKNAIDLLMVCKTENRGINCRMMATMLNECYLAMGIRSRYITCMPRETEFNDCHVINMVYSTELNKWIWIDPTFDAYVMDDKGNLLGIQEVRERLIKDQPLILNADANWNRTSLQSKEHYLDYYMAKNLYRLQVPSTSGYNTETSENEKVITYIELLPIDGIEQNPQKRESTNNKTGMKYVYYRSNNPDLFWKRPE